MSGPNPNPNPYAASQLDPAFLDPETATQYESELMICRRAFSTAQQWMKLYNATDSTYSDVQITWYGTEVDINEGSFGLVQVGSRLEGLVGEIVRVVVPPREVYVYIVASSLQINTEFALARRPMMAINALAIRPGGVLGKLDVRV